MSSKHELEHAVRFAIEQTRLYMIIKYRQLYPDLFQHATFKIRPATNQDYYIPQALALTCHVMEDNYFTEPGCKKVGCFPFKENGVPCIPTDPVQWSQLGNGHTLSCQPICQASDTTVDTEWWNDKCVMVNPLKKIVVMFPERVFGRTTTHQYHNGLTWDEGRVKLNADYCKAYGLDFDGNECVSSTEQTIFEILLGTTVYRSIKTAGMQPAVAPAPPPLPTDLNAIQSPVTVDELTDTTGSSELAKQIAMEISADVGLDIGMRTVEKILKKRVPKLIGKAASSIAVKTALTQAVLKNSAALVAKSFIHMGRAVGAASTILTPYSIVSLVVDLIDPHMYNYMLTGSMVDQLNARLDLQYFQKESQFNQPVTPEYIWDYVLVQPDESDRYSYMADRIEEYLQALRPADITQAPPTAKKEYHYKKEIQRWNWTLHAVVACMLLALAIMWVEWIHVWCGIVLVALMYSG